jgi:hypothetical protein
VGLLRVGSDVGMQLAACSVQIDGAWKVSVTSVREESVVGILGVEHESNDFTLDTEEMKCTASLRSSVHHPLPPPVSPSPSITPLK